MAKVIAFGEYSNSRKQAKFERELQKEIEGIEDKLGIADPLLVLTDDVALNIGNCLIDARDSINQALSLMNIEESEELPDGLK